MLQVHLTHKKDLCPFHLNSKHPYMVMYLDVNHSLMLKGGKVGVQKNLKIIVNHHQTKIH